jgi:transcriptional regulator with XRE-family HTH domain
MIERNKTTNPGVLTVEAIADTLRVSIDYLLGREELDSERAPTERLLVGT